MSFVLYLGILEFCRLLFPRQILYNPFLRVLLHLGWFYSGSAAHRHNLQSIYSILRSHAIYNRLWVDKNELIVSAYESFLIWGDNLIPSMQNKRYFSSGWHYICNCKNITIPGHSLILQTCVSFSDPVHSAPPNADAISIVLDRSCSPSPQSAEQLLHSPKSLHLQSAAKTIFSMHGA